jgi:hypothetical protein
VKLGRKRLFLQLETSREARSIQMSPSRGCTPSVEKVNILHFSLMASSSKLEPSLEERLGEMKMDLINLKAVVKEKERSMQ